MTPPDSISYVECDVPPGQTLAQWRRERAAAAGRARRSRPRRRAALRALRRACGLTSA
jgi:hypothetical protein